MNPIDELAQIFGFIVLFITAIILLFACHWIIGLLLLLFVLVARAPGKPRGKS